MVTENPRDCNNLANDAEIMPLPKDEVTPPVTNIYLVVANFLLFYKFNKQQKYTINSILWHFIR